MLITAHRPLLYRQPALVAAVLCVWAFGAWAQSDELLDTLIFDPVLIGSDAPVLAAGNLAGIRIDRLHDTESSRGGDVFARYDATEEANILAYQQAISDVERQDGPFAQNLVEQLLSLGRLLQLQARHEEAISVLERAEHISRVNNGLYDVQHFPIVESLVESFLALGDFAAVNNRQHYQEYLSRKLEDGATRVPALAGLGDQNMYTFGLALVERDDPNGPGSFSFGGGNVPTGSEISRTHAVNSLYRAKEHYSDAISQLIEDENFRNPRLLELEYKLLETLFLTGYSGEMIGNPHYYITSARRSANMPNRWKHLRRNREGYEAGIDIFERILLYMESDPSTPASEKVRAHLEYADWHLMFDWNDAAMAQYARAWDVAQKLTLDEAEIAGLFRPEYPMQLPLFTPKPNSREKFGISRKTNLDYNGWIDMRFTINGNGTARNIVQVDQSSNTTFDTATRLRRYLKNSPFRPGIENGATVSRDVNMRYYYSFQDSAFQ